MRRKKRRNYSRTAVRYGIAGGRAKAKRKSAKRIAAGKKGARTRKRNLMRGRMKSGWKRATGRKRRLTVKRTAGGRSLMRSPYSRLGYRKGKKVRVNPRRRYVRRYRRRRNPQNMINRMLGRWQLKRALPILVGFAGGVSIKPMAMNFIVPKLPISIQGVTTKWFGILTIVTGAYLSSKARRRMTKDAGLGLIVAGLYDVIASNFANLPFIPKVSSGFVPSAPAAAAEAAATAQGYMGSSIGTGNFTTVGAFNLTQGGDFDTVGEDCDMDDLI